MKHTISTLVVLFLIQLSYGQDFKYGKVSKSEIAQNVHQIDSSANAAMLYKEERISFVYTDYDGFMQEREVYERIKIYNKEGYDWATKKIFVYKGGSGKTEKLTKLKGATYNLINGKIKRDKLKSEGIFEEEYNEYSEITSLTFPNIQDGAVIEYSYTIVSPFLQIDDLNFQSFIPIDRLEVFVATPQFYSYDKQVNLNARYYPEIKEGRQERVFTNTTSSRSNGYVSQTSFNTSKSEYFDRTLTISELNIPAMKAEPYSGNPDKYIAKMSLELAAILNEYGGVEKSISTTWDKVSATINNYKSFGGQFEKSKVFSDDITPIADMASNPFEKGAVLCSYVKSKVKWNGNYGYTANKGIKDAYKEGSGNVGDINLLLVAMLKSQGVNANPVLVSTSDNGVPLFPTRNGFNYVVCSVEYQNKLMLFDATELYSAPNILPFRDLNWQGRLIKEDGTSSWIPMRPKNPSLENTYLNVKLHSDLSAKGKVRKKITAHAALRYRNKFASMATDDLIKEMESGKGSIEISNVNLKHAKDILKPIQVSYEYELMDSIDEIGDKLYFNPLFFLAQKESPFKLETRNYPIDFVTPYKDKYFINIMLPDNYIVESLPTSEILKFKEGQVSYSYIVKQNGQYLQLSVAFDLANSLIDPTDYTIFKEFYEKVIEKQAAQIILSKV